MTTFCKAATAAGALLAGLALLPTPARADDWGCQVLLCMSNPGGPTQFAECVPPIERLWRHLRRGGSFPTCDMAGSPESGGSYVQQVFNPYDLCPAGLQPAPAGQWVGSRSLLGLLPLGGLPADGNTARPVQSEASITSDYGGSLGPRACVGSLMGTTVEGGSDDERITVHVYDAVQWLQPKSPQAFDVYIDSRLFHRVRMQ
jgi:hypothetical protein